jgi:hypothetical protein
VRAFSAILALGLCANAGATTIVAIWTPVKIVISGDSLINSNWTGTNGVPRRRISNDCKIRKFGTNYISAAGNYRIQTAGFDVWKIAEHACGLAIGVDACASNLKLELRTSLAKAVRTREVHVSVLVAGLENGVPALDHITLVGNVQGSLKMQTESFRRGRQSWGRVILGEHAAIDRYEATSPSTESRSIQDQVLTLVRLEARDEPDAVGAPFSVLAIGASGDHWVNPGCCPSACSSKASVPDRTTGK